MNTNTIAAKIDDAFRKKFLLPREKVVTDFLADIMNPQYPFRKDSVKIEVLNVFYEALSPLSFIFAAPSYDHYDQDKTIRFAELDLEADHSFEYYTYIDVDDLCIQVLDENQVDYSGDLDEDEELDPAEYWENQLDLEVDFLVHCWKKAKERTQSQMLGFLESADNTGKIYDLDTGEELDGYVDEYLQSKGRFIKKEIE
ncbi:MAG: hypothetical protein LBE92_17205 [Chryseobacterium sp.]|jgi:hypothetical protein|uniref:hypothetical protein n=1 Tax=Chryseobacterium sp. TaxID=1871047 RepID=UPI00282A82EC|nr:hypothetical protein [Chryseobacterium sp.]MDR2237864.1 hypothetical protein [Chryseobacterium sp.]